MFEGRCGDLPGHGAFLSVWARAESLCGSRVNDKKTLWVLPEAIFLTLLASSGDCQNPDDDGGG